MLELGKPLEKKVCLDIAGKKVIGIVGSAGYGKSTIAEKLAKQIKKAKTHKIYWINEKSAPKDSVKSIVGKYHASNAEELNSLYTVLKGEVATRKLEGLPAEKYVVVVDEAISLNLESEIKAPLEGIDVTFIVVSEKEVSGAEATIEVRSDKNPSLQLGQCILKVDGKEVGVEIPSPKTKEE